MNTAHSLKKIAARFHALESVDKSIFQRKARILQSIWREQQSFPIGEHIGSSGSRPLGSRLQMPEAQTHLWNFLSDRIKEVVRRDVLNPTRSQGKLFMRPRMFNDLLSSQPLCFNLFGELQSDLVLATKVFRRISAGRIGNVTGMEFEHSPGRGEQRFPADKSAFDVFVQFDTPSGGKGFVGIEVKYHENLRGNAAVHKRRYDEIAAAMGCFAVEQMKVVMKQPLQQLWRDHLLAGVLRHDGGYDDGYLLLLYPRDNQDCAAAVNTYGKCLSNSETFAALTLERLVAEIRKQTTADWIERLYDRYLDFKKLNIAKSIRKM